jgi:2-phosphoglycolate phosphatase
MPGSAQAVLFDLDGTLADTAPDLGRALNRLRAARQLPPLSVEQLRAHASSGARGLIKAGLGIETGDPEYDTLRESFLAHYERELCVDTALFPGIAVLLAELESRAVPWGVVTNKAERFTRPLMALLGLGTRAACIVSGDTTPNLKPHPDSLLFASRTLAVVPERCLYLGDDLRDVTAARAARMVPVAVRWGYLGTGAGPEDWGADTVIDDPMDVLGLIATAT